MGRRRIRAHRRHPVRTARPRNRRLQGQGFQASGPARPRDPQVPGRLPRNSHAESRQAPLPRHSRRRPRIARRKSRLQPEKVRGLGRFAHGRLASGLRDAIRKGQKADPVRRPRIRRPGASLSKAQQAEASRHLDRLKKWRAAQGSSLGLDPALIWPMQSLKAIAKSPKELDTELRSPVIRRWQRAEFARSLGDALAH